MTEISMKPIGYAKSEVKQHKFGGFTEEVSEIAVDESFADGLKDLTDNSHVIVVYWMDKVSGYSLVHRPQGNPDVPEVGIFACRCPRRPNSIAMTTVELLEVSGNKVKVKGLDVIDGSDDGEGHKVKIHKKHRCNFCLKILCYKDDHTVQIDGAYH